MSMTLISCYTTVEILLAMVVGSVCILMGMLVRMLVLMQMLVRMMVSKWLMLLDVSVR